MQLASLQADCRRIQASYPEDVLALWDVSQVDQAVLAPRSDLVAAQIQAVQVVLEMVAMGPPLFQRFFDASGAVESVELGDRDLGRHSG